jgi:hypothetical protein
VNPGDRRYPQRYRSQHRKGRRVRDPARLKRHHGRHKLQAVGYAVIDLVHRAWLGNGGKHGYGCGFWESGVMRGGHRLFLDWVTR